MPTLNIEGRKVTVDDSFVNLSPDQQNATVDEIAQSMQAAKPSVAADIAKSGGIGVAKGAIGLAGMVGDLTDLGAAGLRAADRYVSNKFGLEPYKPPQAQSILQNIPGSADIQKSIEGYTGEFYKPQTTAGKYAETVGEFLPGAFAGPGGAVAKVAAAVGGGLASEAAGQATAGGSAEPYARVIGGVAGALTPSALSRVVTPIPTSAARQRLVNVLQDEGVTSLTAGQRTDNKALQYAESILGDAPGAGQGASRVQQEGQRQFTEAAVRRAGAVPDATPEVLSQNYARLGRQFEDLSARNTLRVDSQFANDLTDVVREYGRVLPSEQKERLFNILTDLTQYGGQIPGDVYQAARSRLSRVANNAKVSDPDFGDAMRGVRNALDDAMGRSIAPADRQLWEATRREYGAQKVIEKAASRAGEATAEGQIVPANLRNAVSAENRGAYARGEGAFSELARAGSGVMAPLPNSGTAQRLSLLSLANQATFGAIPAVSGRVLMSRPVQAYLGNQMLPAASGSRGVDAVVNALMAIEQNREALRLSGASGERNR